MIVLPIPSTRGPIAIRPVARSGQRPPEIRSEGDYRPLAVSSDYRAMAATGLIGGRRGDDLPDLVIAREIDSGSSWQLPVALLDVMRRDGCPTTPDLAAASAAVFSTGALRTDGQIETHDYALDLKWPAWEAATRAMRPVLVLLPPSPKRDALALRLAAGASSDLAVECVDDLAAATTALRRWVARRNLPAVPTASPPRRRIRAVVPIVGVSAAALVAVVIASGGARRDETVPPDRRAETETAAARPSPAPQAEPEPLTPSPPPAADRPAIAVAALETWDGTPCPSVELDTTVLRSTPLPLDDALVATVPSDRIVCGVELTTGPDASTRVVVTPELRRRALVSRLADGSVRLRPHAGVTLTDLEIELTRGAGSEPLHLRFTSR
jgi:hypothetical protein